MPEHQLGIVCYHGQVANPGTKMGSMRIGVRPSDKFVAIVRDCCVTAYIEKHQIQFNLERVYTVMVDTQSVLILCT